ncbi:MAG: homoserine kinase [Acidobacteria bacterium]|nr:homoserine kinase [Acidobacteriota bacterium]MCA1618400.1 homoserine kinase [Acidobacteriota bacterium]
MSLGLRGATAFAPATVANVAVGFDILGFAVEAAGDRVRVTRAKEPSVTILEITDDAGAPFGPGIPLDPSRNTATVGLSALLEERRLDFGFEVSISKGIALGSGLGGSAASAVAALVAANALLERPLAAEDLMPFALLGEQAASGAIHPDNVAPCLLGGLTLVTSLSPFRCVRLPVPREILTVLVHPRLRVDTRGARRLLRAEVPLADLVKQTASLAGFVAGCYTDDLELIRQSLRDHVVEPQRATLIPAFAEVKAAALAEGALGASISGSGPTVFAWVASPEAAERVRHSMLRAFMEHGGAEADSWVSPVSEHGARVLNEE